MAHLACRLKAAENRLASAQIFGKSRFDRLSGQPSKPPIANRLTASKMPAGTVVVKPGSAHPPCPDEEEPATCASMSTPNFAT
ncbi:hypothetical protein [Bosea sp. CRIB-10]|uniref:hypothetical protein n=1 Tax=Bosea sp. CRIB-10 TaxID=378404 RepID=UPI0011137B84|nr:hypothetical protein [Bosea sp. CRIB-10]